LVLLCLYFGEVESNLNAVKRNTEMINIGSFRLNRLLEFKKVTSLLVMYRNGIVNDTRFSVNDGPPFITSAVYVAAGEQKELLDANNRLRISLNSTHRELQNRIFNNIIPMKLLSGGILERNTLDATNELVARMAAVANLPAEAFQEENKDIDFIYNNILDETLLSSEEIFTILVEDNDQNIRNTRSVGIGLMVGALGIAILLFMFALYELKIYFTHRDSFLNIFLRLDENEIEKHLLPIRNFLFKLQSQAMIDINQFKVKEVAKLKVRSKTDDPLSATEAVAGLKMRPKKASLDKNNQVLLRIGLLKTLILLMLIFPFVHILILMESNSSAIKSNIDTIIEVNDVLYQIVVLYVSFYDYVYLNGDATLRSRPIKEEWDRIYTKTLTTADFLSNLLISTQQDETMSTEDKEYVTELINGNLCEVLPETVLQYLCPMVSNGFLTKGIQSISIYMLNVLKAAKTQYDSSGKTVDDVKEVIGLKSLIDIEMSVWQWQYTSYIELSNVFRKWMTSSIDNIEGDLTWMTVFYCFWYLVFITLSSYKLERYVGGKARAWQKVCRKIPINIVNEVKPLKFHLFKNGGAAFKSLESSVF